MELREEKGAHEEIMEVQEHGAVSEILEGKRGRCD